MKKTLMRLTVTAIFLLGFSLSCFAGELDDKYLAAFGLVTPLQNGSSLQKAILLPATGSGEPPHCGTPLKHGLSHDWHKLEPATQKVLAKQLAAPVLAGEVQYPSTGGHFLIHYATVGTDVPSPPAGYTLLSWIQQVADSFEDVYTKYTATYGYRPPPLSGRYNVYLRDLVAQRIFGQTTTIQSFPSPGFPYAFTSYIEIDKDFTNVLYTKPNNLYTPLNSLNITASHEFHHAIQYGYSYYFDIWYAEATSSWFEDELHDEVNQLYNYLPAWFSNTNLSLDTAVSLTTGGGYGRWLFNRYLAEQYGITVVRSAWEKLAALNPSNGADIPMVPVLEGLLSAAPFNGSLGADFFGLAKRFYRQDQWTSHTTDVNRIYNHPLAVTSTFSSYPVTSSTINSSITLPHYSFAYFKFSPSATSPAILNIYVNRTSGISAAVFKKIAGVISEVTPNTNGTSFTISNFNASSPASDEVVLLLANITNVDNHQASFSTNGSSTTVTEPPNTPATTLTPSASGGGSSGGCFIATAAYGSYLHPQVHLLRVFRDQHLLTNRPGRAFVELYYSISPPVADFIAQHSTLRFIMRILLTPLVFAVKYPLIPGTALLLALFWALIAIRRQAKFAFGQS